MQNRFKGKMLVYIVLFLLISVNVSILPVNATSMVPTIYLDEYCVSSGKIIPGEEFVLTLKFKNYGKDTIQAAMVDIMNPTGISPVYGTVSQAYIGEIAAGAVAEVSIEYESLAKITAETLDFDVTVVTDMGNNYITLRIPAGVDVPLSIVSSSGASEAFVGEEVSYSVTFRTLGKENVSNVGLMLEVDGKEIEKNIIGILTPGTTKSHTVFTTFDTVGTHTSELVLTYMDSTGVKKEISVGEIQVNVTEKNIVQDNTSVDKPFIEPAAEQNNDSALLMGVSAVAILLIFLIIVVLMRKGR